MNSKVKVAWVKTQDSLVINYNGETHCILKSGSGYDQVLKAIKDQAFDQIPNLVSIAKRIEVASKGLFKVENGQVSVDGVVVPSLLGVRILEFEKEGLPFQPLVNFARNLNKNPSYRSVQQLFLFLEKNRHPITDDGCFIAYKKVMQDFKDCHSGTFDNSVGTTVEMPRNQVDEDPNRTCSNGLHVANWEYAKNFQAGLMLQVKVNPTDVVAVPVDYNNAKMRVCKYEVMSVVENPSDDLLLDSSGKKYEVDSDEETDEEFEEDCCNHDDCEARKSYQNEDEDDYDSSEDDEEEDYDDEEDEDEENW